MRLLQEMCEIHAPSGEESAMTKFLLNYINNNQKNTQSWIKIVEHLLEITEMTGTIPSNDVTENNKIIKKFKNNQTTVFNKWWNRQAVITGQNKLDFYYKHKKVFKTITKPSVFAIVWGGIQTLGF